MRKVVADAVRINRATGEVVAQPQSLAAAKCQVQTVIHDDGTIDEPICVSVSCDGNCNMQQEQHGSVTHYNCTCD